MVSAASTVSTTNVFFLNLHKTPTWHSRNFPKSQTKGTIFLLQLLRLKICSQKLVEKGFQTAIDKIEFKKKLSKK